MLAGAVKPCPLSTFVWQNRVEKSPERSEQISPGSLSRGTASPAPHPDVVEIQIQGCEVACPRSHNECLNVKMSSFADHTSCPELQDKQEPCGELTSLVLSKATLSPI